MKHDLFRRYVWLVDTVRHAKKLQFEQIAEKWLSASLNVEKTPLALRTFHNHRQSVKDLFGINIKCDRSDNNNYYIVNDAADHSSELKIWMLHYLGTTDLNDDIKNLGNRIRLDSVPEDRWGLYEILSAIQSDRVLSITLKEPLSNGKKSLCLAPYVARFSNDKWNVTGKDIESGEICELGLDMLENINLTDASFKLPEDFNLNL